MTTTTILAVPTTRPIDPTESASPVGRKQLFGTGVRSGLLASAATVAFAAVAHAFDVSLRISGKAIPLPGFAQLTFAGAIVGTILAVAMSRRARRPRRTFATTTIVLTALSIVPDILVNAQVATKGTLALTHVIAAAIVIPALSSRLAD